MNFIGAIPWLAAQSVSIGDCFARKKTLARNDSDWLHLFNMLLTNTEFAQFVDNHFYGT
jgi:hypothetical protein